MVIFTGKKALSDVVKLFDKDVLKQLKSECGGLQTLLRNHNSVFNGKSLNYFSVSLIYILLAKDF